LQRGAKLVQRLISFVPEAPQDQQDPVRADEAPASGMRLRLVCLAAPIAAAATITVGLIEAKAAGNQARAVAAADPLEAAVLGELNAVRREHGLRPLRRSAPLATAADAHTGAMAEFGIFQHESRDGSAFRHRVKRFYSSRGYDQWSVGENLLWSTTGLDAKRALELWMASPSHRKNILTPRWREVGLSAVTAAGARGVYGGRDVVIITTDFGVRG
jgi:uncharacterized protein YkwD